MIKYLNETEVSKMLGVTLSTLRSRRVSGGGINFIKVGRLVRYPLNEVENYLASRLVNSTTEYQEKIEAELASKQNSASTSKFTPKKEDSVNG